LFNNIFNLEKAETKIVYLGIYIKNAQNIQYSFNLANESYLKLH